MGTVANLRTSPALNLDERIAAAFEKELTSSEINALLQETQQADEAAVENASRARSTALDPATKPSAVADARRAMDDALFRSERMVTATSRLKVLLEEAEKREAKAAASQEMNAALTERDALAKELRETYPKLSAELIDLLQRVAANDERLHRCSGLQHHTAEHIARNAPENWAVVPDSRLPKLTKTVRLPSFKSTPNNYGYDWPRAF